jgi:hypothetical protein
VADRTREASGEEQKSEEESKGQYGGLKSLGSGRRREHGNDDEPVAREKDRTKPD